MQKICGFSYRAPDVRVSILSNLLRTYLRRRPMQNAEAFLPCAGVTLSQCVVTSLIATVERRRPDLNREFRKETVFETVALFPSRETEDQYPHFRVMRRRHGPTGIRTQDLLVTFEKMPTHSSIKSQPLHQAELWAHNASGLWLF